MIIRENCLLADPKKWPCPHLVKGMCTETCEHFKLKESSHEEAVRRKKMELKLNNMRVSGRPSCMHGVPLLRTCKRCQNGIGGKDNVRQVGE